MKASEPARFAVWVVGTTMVGALLGCAGHPARYSAVVAEQGPVASGQIRVVLLRPNGRYDDYSLTKAVIAVNDTRVGKLAYGAFLVLDVVAGDVAIEASTRNRMFGRCELSIAALPGSTVYVDIAPRIANVVAGLAGSVAGVAAVGSGPTSVGVREILVDQSTVRTAVGSTAGGAVASAAESTGKECGGPFKLTPISASSALEQLDRLSWSQ